jgi:hypothetical protein
MEATRAKTIPKRQNSRIVPGEEDRHVTLGRHSDPTEA